MKPRYDTTPLVLFFFLPKEMLRRYPHSQSLPPCPHEAFHTDRYSTLVASSAFAQFIRESFCKHDTPVAEIAKKLGNKSHSAVVRRLNKLAGQYRGEIPIPAKQQAAMDKWMRTMILPLQMNATLCYTYTRGDILWITSVKRYTTKPSLAREQS